MTMRVGAMAWRIGRRVDLYEQLAWLRRHCFAAVGLWASAGEPGVWQGFDATTASAGEVARLRGQLSGFAVVDMHAGVPLTDRAEESGALAELRRTIAVAGDLGAATVTVHVEARAGVTAALRELNGAALAAGVRIGLELTGDYDLAQSVETPQVGLTLDLGHVSFGEGAGYREFGSLPGLITHCARRLVHVHAHDWDGVADHLPIGRGVLDWEAIVGALKASGYADVVCLELNPDRASPADLLASRRRLEALIGGR